MHLFTLEFCLTGIHKWNEMILYLGIETQIYISQLCLAVS